MNVFKECKLYSSWLLRMLLLKRTFSEIQVFLLILHSGQNKSEIHFMAGQKAQNAPRWKCHLNMTVLIIRFLGSKIKGEKSLHPNSSDN